MGVYTFLYTGTDEEPRPRWSSKDFSKIVDVLPGRLTLPDLPDAVTRAIEPLTRIGHIEDLWKRDHDWQEPAVLLAAVEAALAMLHSDPTPLKQRHVIRSYYTAESLERDLNALKADLEQAIARDIPRVRLLQSG